MVVVDGTTIDADDLLTLQQGDITVLQADPQTSPFADMHLKLAVVDAATVLVGSFNWTTNGNDDSDENLVIATDPILAARTEGRFADLFTTYGPLNPAEFGLVTGEQSVTLSVSNLTVEPGAVLEVVSIGPGPFEPAVTVPAEGLTVSLPTGTHLEYRYRVVGPTGATITESGERHTFTVPYAAGPFVLNDVFRP